MKLINSICAVLFFTALLPAQNISKKEFIEIVPGEKYAASAFHEFWFGEHWRDIWSTPIKVEVLDLSTPGGFAGGLIPVKKGGGFQTKSLRFIGNDGRAWKFRSLDKDPTKVLPPDLQETIADNVIQDQISSSNPFSPFVVQPLLDAVGILSVDPILVYLPDDEMLGEFRSEFGGTLGIIEEHPDVTGEEDHPGFKDALDVKGTYNLLEHLEKKRKQKIDSEEFLKARLMDILVGDWDRHMDQWRWAKYEEADGKVWYPVPRDRDQAFAKYDGFFPFIAAYLVPQLNHFGYEYPDMEDLTWNGRFLDRRVLTELDKNSWDSVTAFVQNKITDEVIEFSVMKLPPEIYQLCAVELIEKLKSRRDKLAEASNSFYNLVNKYAEIFCSAENDFVEVKRIDDRTTEISVYRRDKETGDKNGKPLFNKIFDNEISFEIRVQMNDGDDKAIITGRCNESPVIRIIGGKGKDEMIDSSVVEGHFLSITPFRSTQTKSYFYDDGKKTKVVEGPGTVYDDYDWPEPIDEYEKYEPQQIDRGHNWLPVPVFGFDTDYGLTIGGGVALHKYNFRAVPQEYLQQLTISYATRFSNFDAVYKGDFYSLLRNGKLSIILAYSQQFVTRYFGYGNSSTYDAALEQADYYRVDQSLLTFYPTFFYNFSKIFSASLGISFIRTKTSMLNDTLLSDFRYGDYGIGILNPLGIHLGFELESRQNQNYPVSGYFFKAAGSVFPAVNNIPETFFRSVFDARTYFTPQFLSFSTLVLRAGGSKVWGKYPFFGGASVGGKDNLRGYNDKRFSGDAALFGQAELRLFITDIKLILKSRFGINIFAETGRVFTANGSSEKWHPSYGAGLWLSYFDSEIIPAVYIAFSPDRTTFALELGLGF